MNGFKRTNLNERIQTNGFKRFNLNEAVKLWWFLEAIQPEYSLFSFCRTVLVLLCKVLHYKPTKAAHTLELCHRQATSVRPSRSHTFHPPPPSLFILIAHCIVTIIASISLCTPHNHPDHSSASSCIVFCASSCVHHLMCILCTSS